MNNKNFVFDTNALISSALIESSINHLALDRAFKKGNVIVSEASMSEFTEVLFRKKFDKYLNYERRL